MMSFTELERMAIKNALEQAIAAQSFCVTAANELNVPFGHDTEAPLYRAYCAIAKTEQWLKAVLVEEGS